MLYSIGLKISPKFIGKRIFRIGSSFQYISKCMSYSSLFREFKMFGVMENLSIKSDNHYSFTMLRHIFLSVHHTIMNGVIQFFQCLSYNPERLAFVMRNKILHIL